MTRLQLSGPALEALKQIDAEHYAVRQLSILPPRVAAVTAVKAAIELFGACEIYISEIARRGDQTLVYMGTLEQRIWLSSAFSEYCADELWRRCPTPELRDQLGGLTPDAAAIVAYKVARWADNRNKTASYPAEASFANDDMHSHG